MDSIYNQKLTRKEFLVKAAVAILSLIGLSRLVKTKKISNDGSYGGGAYGGVR